jgi:hypothetical protein
MENKTALQELMEWMIEESQVIPVDPGDVYRKAEELLAKEKEQIKNAYEEGEDNIDSDGCQIEKKDSEQYYNETYGNITD